MGDLKKELLKTKKAFIFSFILVLVSVFLLCGTTYAWFSDEEASTGNKIESGELKIGLLELSNDNSFNCVKETPLFSGSKWEPGYSDVSILKIVNNGNLALKWELSFNELKESSILKDVIDVYVVTSDDELGLPESYKKAVEEENYLYIGTLGECFNKDYILNGNMYETKEAKYVGIILHMQESAGNEYQGLSIGDSFDIKLYATQLNHEQDGFNNPDYDLEAK